MRGPRFINEIQIDNLGNRGIHILGRQGGVPVDWHLSIAGDVQEELSRFEENLMRLLDERRRREELEQKTQLSLV